MSSLLFYIVFGFIVGTVANYVDPHPNRYGIVGSIVLGIVGALLGGYLGDTLLGVGVTGFNLSSFVVAVLGALLALFIGRTLSRSTV